VKMIGRNRSAHAALRHGALEPTRTNRTVASKDVCTIKEIHSGCLDGIHQSFAKEQNTSLWAIGLGSIMFNMALGYYILQSPQDSEASIVSNGLVQAVTAKGSFFRTCSPTFCLDLTRDNVSDPTNCPRAERGRNGQVSSI
jgi:hypothetical protein